MSKPNLSMEKNQFEIEKIENWAYPHNLLSKLVGFFLAAFGSLTLAWVGHLVWNDITVWDKSISLIFFGSRTGENISLGIGMKVIYYFLLGLALLLPGLVILLRARRKRIKCPHHFGYLAKLPKNTPIPKECLFCKRTDCIETRFS